MQQDANYNINKKNGIVAILFTVAWTTLLTELQVK